LNRFCRSTIENAREETYGDFLLNELTSGSWLTARRLRAHGVILALCLWLLYGWNIATPGLHDRNGNLKGTDFLHFYTLGLLADAHRGADLYDVNAQAALAAQRVPEAAGLRYLPLYPPQVSLLFAPLARLPYGWALIMWWACSAVLYGACCFGTWRACPNLRDQAGTVFVLAAGFPAFVHLIAWGQTSALALACFTLLFFQLRARRNFVAGLILGCLVFKPQLALAAAVVFVSVGVWRVVAGAILSAAAQLGVGVLFYGAEPLWRWMQMLGNVGAFWPSLEPRPYQTHSLRSFWALLIPWASFASGLYILSAIVALSLVIACWKRGESVPLELRYSALLLATVLVAPHLTVYDLVILAPAFLLLAEWLMGHVPDSSSGMLAALLYLVYLLPLAGPLARWTHVQLSVIAMAAALFEVWRIAASSPLTESSKAFNR
jgi:alpha-1,2-mannosyltransferase